MSGGIIETASASASGSLIAFFLIRLWRNLSRRIKMRGLLIGDNENWQKLEQFSNEDIIFINLKKCLGKDYPSEISKSDIRLKVYPKAKTLVNNLKDQFKKKTIVLLTDDLELLKFVGLKNKWINTILPSEQLIEQLHKANPNEDYSKMKLDVLKTLDKTKIHIIDKETEIISKVRDLYNLCLK